MPVAARDVDGERLMRCYAKDDRLHKARSKSLPCLPSKGKPSDRTKDLPNDEKESQGSDPDCTKAKAHGMTVFPWSISV